MEVGYYLFNEKTNLNADNDIKNKIIQSNFVFSYSYGFLLSEKTNFTQLIVLDGEVIVKKRFSNTDNNIDISFQRSEQAKKLKNIFYRKIYSIN